MKIMEGFDFQSPKTLTDAFRAIAGEPSACKLLAGGTNVVPSLREGSLKPSLVVDLGGIEELKYIREEQGWIQIGPMTTINEILSSSLIKEKGGLLWEATRTFGGALVRNRATVGGNLADASPAADTAPPLLALGAQVTLQSSEGQRTLPLSDFFSGYRQTVIKPGEILTKVSFKTLSGESRYAYCKLGRRSAMAISVVSVAVLFQIEGDICKEAAIALGAVDPTPIRALKAEALIKGKNINSSLADECGKVIAGSVNPVDDIRASADYRRTLTHVLVSRLICQSLGIEN
jgi:carbon-monoxide dehydrogenase medium subunit